MTTECLCLISLQHSLSLLLPYHVHLHFVLCFAHSHPCRKVLSQNSVLCGLVSFRVTNNTYSHSSLCLPMSMAPLQYNTSSSSISCSLRLTNSLELIVPPNAGIEINRSWKTRLDNLGEQTKAKQIKTTNETKRNQQDMIKMNIQQARAKRLYLLFVSH